MTAPRSNLDDPRRSSPPDYFRGRGFTMIETVIVLVLIALVLAMAAPSLGGWRRGAALRDAADDVLAATAWSRTQAIADAAPYQMVIDPSGRGCRVMTVRDGAAAPAGGEFGRSLQLPPSLRLDVVNGPTTIQFHPNGRTTPAVLQIATLDGRQRIELRSDAPAEPFRLAQEFPR